MLVSALGWLASAACVLAAPTRDHEVVAVAVIAASTVVLSAFMLLSAVEQLPGAASSAAARLRRSVDGLQVTSALLLSGWTVAALVSANDDRIAVHGSPTWIASAVSVVGLAAAISFTVVEVRHAPRPRARGGGRSMTGIVARCRWRRGHRRGDGHVAYAQRR